MSRNVDECKPLLAGNLTQAVEDALAIVSVGGTPDFTLVSAHPVHPKANTVMQSLTSNSSSSVGPGTYCPPRHRYAFGALIFLLDVSSDSCQDRARLLATSIART